MRPLALAAACTGALLLAARPAAAVPLVNVPPALSDARAAIAGLGSYTTDVFVREINHGRGHDRSLTIAYKRPGFVKMTIVDGSSAGSEIAWRGEGKAKLRRLGLLQRLPAATVDKNAPALAFANGEPITAALFSSVVDAFDPASGTIVQSVGPVIDGLATDDVTESFTQTAPAKAMRLVVTFERGTHLPVRLLRYVDDTLVQLDLFEHVVPNAPLRDADLAV